MQSKRRKVKRVLSYFRKMKVQVQRPRAVRLLAEFQARTLRKTKVKWEIYREGGLRSCYLSVFGAI